jgi:hypothetical protein
MRSSGRVEVVNAERPMFATFIVNSLPRWSPQVSLSRKGKVKAIALTQPAISHAQRIGEPEGRCMGVRFSLPREARYWACRVEAPPTAHVLTPMGEFHGS